jgi:hypothetical protein
MLSTGLHLTSESTVGGGDPEDDRALDLRPDDIGIDHNAAIDRADDARPLPSRPSYGSSSIRPPS